MFKKFRTVVPAQVETDIRAAHVKAFLIAEEGYEFNEIIDKQRMVIPQLPFSIKNIVPRRTVRGEYSFASDEFFTLWRLMDALQTLERNLPKTNVKNPFLSFGEKDLFLKPQEVFANFYPEDLYLPGENKENSTPTAPFYRALVGRYCDRLKGREIVIPPEKKQEILTTKKEALLAALTLFYKSYEPKDMPQGMVKSVGVMQKGENTENILQVLKDIANERQSKGILSWCYHKVRGRCLETEKFYHLLAIVDFTSISSVEQAKQQISLMTQERNKKITLFEQKYILRP